MIEISPQQQRGLQDYIEFFEKLSPRSIRLLDKVAEDALRFSDPAHDVMGLDEVRRVLEHRLASVEKPKIKVSDYGWSKAQEGTAYIRWYFSYESNDKKRHVDGMSEIVFSPNGKAMMHTDFWDAGKHLYENVPLLGAGIRFVKSKFKI